MSWRGALSLTALCMALVSVGCSGSSNPDPQPDMKIVKSIRGSEDAGEDEVAAAPTGVGWGTLRGRFVLDGAAPSLPNLTASKDADVCGKVPLLNETLVVAGDKGIANIVVYATKVSRVNQEVVDVALADPVLFDQANCVFLTHVFPVLAKQTITLKNSDSVSHNANISPRGDKAFNQLIASGGEVAYAFGRQQSVPFAISCNVHPWMRAYMFPRDDTYVAVSAADGSFEITDLPAGEEIEFRVWHETATGGLVAKADWAKGQFSETVPADDATDLGEIAVPISAFSLP